MDPLKTHSPRPDTTKGKRPYTFSNSERKSLFFQSFDVSYTLFPLCRRELPITFRRLCYTSHIVYSYVDFSNVGCARVKEWQINNLFYDSGYTVLTWAFTHSHTRPYKTRQPYRESFLKSFTTWHTKPRYVYTFFEILWIAKVELVWFCFSSSVSTPSFPC